MCAKNKNKKNKRTQLCAVYIRDGLLLSSFYTFKMVIFVILIFLSMCTNGSYTRSMALVLLYTIWWGGGLDCDEFIHFYFQGVIVMSIL